MRPLRVLLALLLSAMTIAVIARVMVPRVQCNLTKGQVNRTVRRFNRVSDEYKLAIQARRNLAQCDACLRVFPEDYQLHVLRGANLRILGSEDEAVRAFQHALTLSERPEIYAQIAELEVERGNVEAARRALLRAAFYDISYVDTVDDPLKSEVHAAAYERIDRLLAAKKR